MRIFIALGLVVIGLSALRLLSYTVRKGPTPLRLRVPAPSGGDDLTSTVRWNEMLRSARRIFGDDSLTVETVRIATPILQAPWSDPRWWRAFPDGAVGVVLVESLQGVTPGGTCRGATVDGVTVVLVGLDQPPDCLAHELSHWWLGHHSLRWLAENILLGFCANAFLDSDVDFWFWYKNSMHFLSKALMPENAKGPPAIHGSAHMVRHLLTILVDTALVILLLVDILLLVGLTKAYFSGGLPEVRRTVLHLTPFNFEVHGSRGETDDPRFLLMAGVQGAVQLAATAGALFGYKALHDRRNSSRLPTRRSWSWFN
jgi:hypothetical protein